MARAMRLTRLVVLTPAPNPHTVQAPVRRRKPCSIQSRAAFFCAHLLHPCMHAAEYHGAKAPRHHEWQEQRALQPRAAVEPPEQSTATMTVARKHKRHELNAACCHAFSPDKSAATVIEQAARSSRGRCDGSRINRPHANCKIRVRSGPRRPKPKHTGCYLHRWNIHGH